MRISLPRHDLLEEERLTSLSEEKGLKPLSQWAFIGLSLHKNTGGIYIKLINHCQTVMIKEWITFKELWGLILSQGQIDRVTPKGHKTLGNKLILYFDT